MKIFKGFLNSLLVLLVVGLMFLPSSFAFATNMDKELTDREKAAFIVRNEWTNWVKAFTASLSELDKNATSRIYDNMDFYDMQYRFTEKYKKVPEYLDEDGKPTQKLKDLIKRKRKELNGATIIDPEHLNFTSKQDGSTIKYVLTSGFDENSIDIGWSYDGQTWTHWYPDEALTPDQGRPLYIWNKSSTLSSTTAQFKFVLTGTFDAAGNINSLINFKDMSAGCYYGLFEDQSSLVIPPELPMTELAPYCYGKMFKGCTSLGIIPTLPARVLAEGCYEHMFENCAFTKGPDLNAKVFADNCYRYLFSGCSNLNYIKLGYMGGFEDRYFENWVSGVQDSGQFYYNGTDINHFGSSAIPKDDLHKWDVIIEITELSFTALENSTVKWQVNGSIGTEPDIYYSDDDRTTWKPWTRDTEVNIPITKVIYVKNNNNTLSINEHAYVNFVMTGKIQAGGDVTSMINNVSVVPKAAFHRLFKDCVSLTTAPLMPATSLNTGGYNYSEMFYSCTNLVTAPPVLPAEVIGMRSYYQMFYGCTNLKKPPEIKATTLEELSCYAMFEKCGLTQAPTLNADIVPKKAYAHMFNDCDNLVVPPYLPATQIGESAYEYMFYSCNKLKAAPNLPATQIANACYYYMFAESNEIVAAPFELPATVLAEDCYRGMYAGCTGLVSPSRLPATVLADNCYFNMYGDCINLEVAPELPATTLATGCYRSMFSGCSKLTYISLKYTGDFDDSNFLSWVYGVRNIGQIRYKGTHNKSGKDAIPNGWEWVNENTEVKFFAREDSTVKWIQEVNSGSTVLNVQMSYSYDRSTWNSWPKDNTINLSAGACVYVKNTASVLSTQNCRVKFVMTGAIAASGDIKSLMNNQQPTADDRICYGLFNGCAALIIPPELTPTSVGKRGYYEMFRNCSNLIVAPEMYHISSLDNISLSNMFMGTTKLYTPPKLLKKSVSVTFAPYSHMFDGSGIRVAPDLPHTNLVKSMYASMFSNCNNLTTAPELPATVLAEQCYDNMFNSCSNLIIAPSKLPAQVMQQYCYREMFFKCTSLETAPEICATNVSANNCLRGMFEYDTSLNYIKLSYTGNFITSSFEKWVEGVSSTGVFVYDGSDSTRGASAIPVGWEVYKSSEMP